METRFLSKPIGIALLACFLVQSNALAQDENELPSAKKVIGDFVDALGGEMAIESIGAFSVKGKVTTSRHTGPIWTLYSEGRMVSETQYDGFATIRQGIDKDTSWHFIRVTGAPEPTVNVEKRNTRSRWRFAMVAAHLQALAWLEFEGDIKVESKTETDDQEVWEVKLIPKTTPEVLEVSTVHAYFCVDTGLLLRTVYDFEKPEMPDMIREFEYHDEPTNEVRFWKRVTLTHQDNKTVYEYESVDLEPDFSDEDFSPPEEIDEGDGG